MVTIQGSRPVPPVTRIILHRHRCPKCGGNVCLRVDHYGWYWYCIRCGKTWEIDPEAVKGET